MTPRCVHCGRELTDQCVTSRFRKNKAVYCDHTCRRQAEPEEVPVLTIPSRWPVRMHVYKDVGKRRARCFICDLTVKKGEPRLRIEADGPWTDNGAGGQWKIRRSFCHPACWIKPFFNPDDKLPVRKCALCEEPLTTFGGFLFRDGGSHSVCSPCIDSDVLKRCALCHLFHLTRLCSPLRPVSPPDGHVGVTAEEGDWGCNNCIDLFEFPSLRLERRQLREDRILHLQIEKIRAGWD